MNTLKKNLKDNSNLNSIYVYLCNLIGDITVNYYTCHNNELIYFYVFQIEELARFAADYKII